MTSAAEDGAIAAAIAGLSVVPPRQDGTKGPLSEPVPIACDHPACAAKRAAGDLTGWTHRQHTAATIAELEQLYAQGLTGVGLACGYAGLEMVELEAKAVADGLVDIFAERMGAAGLGELWARVNLGWRVRTPTGGLHWHLRTDDPLPNQKLAFRPPTPAEVEADLAERRAELPDGANLHPGYRTPHVLLAETRGTGGFTIAAPTNGGVHPRGGSWTTEAGGPATVPHLTTAERDALYDVFRTLDTRPPPPVAEPIEVARTPYSGPASAMWMDATVEHYNRDTTWDTVLAGRFDLIGQKGGERYWRAVGTQSKYNATTNAKGTDTLCVFGSSLAAYGWDVYDGSGKATTYDRFAATVMILTASSDQAARLQVARELREQGYGPPPPARTSNVYRISDGRTGTTDEDDLEPGRYRPVIIVNNRELHEVRSDTAAAMSAAQAECPELFVRDGSPVVVSIDEDEQPKIRDASIAALRNTATDAATFVTRNVKATGEISIKSVSPPRDVVEAVAALTPLPFPPLRSVVEAPTLRTDGTVISAAGYDTATGVYFADRTGDQAIAPRVTIPQDPGPDEVDAARDDLLHLLSDFPFVDQASRANMLALLVLAVIRSAVDGATPLHVLDAPTPGTGKSLLAAITGILALGRVPEMQSVPDDPAEWRKMLTSALVEGQRLVILDNVSGGLASPYLAQVLTERAHADRRLGTNSTVRVPNWATWMCTGNGVALRGDLPRRAVWVRLDPRTARPWDRDGFRYPDIVAHALGNRPRYLSAVLTMARGWFSAGQPAPALKPLGSFERWAIVVGGILEFAGVNGFMANAAEAWAEGDGETTDMGALLAKVQEWRAGCSTNVFRVSDLAEKFSPDLTDRREWLDVCPPEWTQAADGKGAGLNRKIGEHFKTIAGRRWDDTGLRIVKSAKKDRNKVVLWEVTSDDVS